MSKNGRVLVAMSGGIDSTATAMMLHEEGYEVVGITMKTWDYANSGGSKKETGCCSLDSINDARAVAVKMGFHHFIVDIREEFGDSPNLGVDAKDFLQHDDGTARLVAARACEKTRHRTAVDGYRELVGMQTVLQGNRNE